MPKKSTEEIMQEMDAAAKEASDELDLMYLDHPEAVGLVAEWWNRHFGKAGHKRLGRVLREYAPSRFRMKGAVVVQGSKVEE